MSGMAGCPLCHQPEALSPTVPRQGLGAPSRTTGRTAMADDLNRDGVENQIKGSASEVEGKIRNAVGGLTGDTSEQIKGKAQELKGKVQRKIGEARATPTAISTTTSLTADRGDEDCA